MSAALWNSPRSSGLNSVLSCLPLTSRRLIIFPRGQRDNGKHVSIYLDAPETQFKSTPPQVWNAVYVGKVWEEYWVWGT